MDATTNQHYSTYKWQTSCKSCMAISHIVSLNNIGPLIVCKWPYILFEFPFICYCCRKYHFSIFLVLSRPSKDRNWTPQSTCWYISFILPQSQCVVKTLYNVAPGLNILGWLINVIEHQRSSFFNIFILLFYILISW